MKKIETGVDKLVELIAAKKRVSLDDAAKELGVSTVLVQEWADFLEEDGLISLDYSLSKVWLQERQFSEKEVKVREKEYEHRKEGFRRKVETTLKSLDRETIGFENLKKEFEDLRKEIGGELDSVEGELRQLQKFENLKNHIDKDIERQKTEYEELMIRSHSQIKNEERRYQDLIAQLQQEQNKIEKGKKDIDALESQEEKLIRKIHEMDKLVDGIKSKIKKEHHDLDVGEENIKRLQILVEQIVGRVKTKRHASILPLLRLSEEHRSKIIRLQEEIVQKLKEKQDEIGDFENQTKDVHKNMSRFFKKKDETHNLLKNIELSKKALQKEYENLIKRAEVFDAMNKDDDVQKKVEELEKEFHHVEKHRDLLHEEIRKLTAFIKG